MRNRISRNELPEKRLLLFFVIIFLVWFCWKPYFLSFFNDYIIRYLDIRTSSLTDALFIVISLSILVAIIMGIRRRYTTSYAHIFLDIIGGRYLFFSQVHRWLYRRVALVRICGLQRYTRWISSSFRTHVPRMPIL